MKFQSNSLCGWFLSALLIALPITLRADDIYVSTNNSILKFTPAGGNSVFANVSLTAINSLAFDHAGNLYATLPNNPKASPYPLATIERFTPDGVGSPFVTVTLSGINTLGGLAFDATGNLYYGADASSSIEKITPAGTISILATATVNPPVNIDDPNGLAVDSAGNVYVANDFGGIEKITPGGKGSLFNLDQNFPLGIAFDSAGNLFAADAGGSIEKITPAGVASTFAIYSGGIGAPSGLAFDRAGNLYMTDEKSLIDKFTPAGVKTVFANLGFVGPSSIAISHTPLAPPAAPVVPSVKTSIVSTNSNYKTSAAITAAGGYGSTLSLLDGIASGDKTIALAATNTGAGFTSLASDVMSVTGNAGDTFVLSLKFDPTAAATLGGASQMQLLWLNPDNNNWELAVFGNTGASTPMFINGAYNPNLDLVLGYYGVDASSNSVWAVINHNSNFAAANLIVAPEPLSAVPEPASIVSLSLCAGALLLRRRAPCPN